MNLDKGMTRRDSPNIANEPVTRVAGAPQGAMMEPGAANNGDWREMRHVIQGKPGEQVKTC